MTNYMNINNKNYQERKISEYCNNIQSILTKIESLNYYYENCPQEEMEFVSKDINYNITQLSSYIKEIYYLLISYLEISGNLQLLTIFKNEFLEVYENKFNPIEIYTDEDGDFTYYSSPQFTKLKNFLLPFEPFNLESNNNSTSILENILTNTPLIIKERGIQPNSETSVYNGVKLVIQSAFPDWIDASREPFYKLAKCYKPDILVPSLHIAIEYKYAEDEKTLIKTIDEILIDVQGYANHHTYSFFYAVFYVKIGVCNEQRFQLLWTQKNFPQNWKPIFVLGK